MILISPSILSSDFANLEREVRAVAEAGAELVHVDVMDGHFVPNLTIGIPVVEALKKACPVPLDVHLMISEPGRYAERFVRAGSDLLTFHLESEGDAGQIIRTIHAAGAKAGVALKPGTPAQAAFPYLLEADMILVMTVEPGFGGQKFIEDMCPKIRAIRRECEKLGRAVDIQVDGGIAPGSAAKVAAAGANVLVAGSSVFGKPPYHQAVEAIRRDAQRGLLEAQRSK